MTEKSESTEAVLGEVDVRTARGETFHVRPWGVKTGGRLMRRIQVVLTMAEMARKGDVDFGALLSGAWNEVLGVVADSVGVGTDDLEDDERFALEDVINLVEAIVRVNFVERPGLGKAVAALTTTFERLTAETETPTSTPPPSSS